MSIFPKRTIQGKTVTIHWSFNTSNLIDKHLVPLVKIGVKDPNGNVTMLFEEHVVAFPDQKEKKTESVKKLKYLSKSVPLLVLADYLEGHCKREKLVEILTNIKSARHLYFTYNIPDNAPIGKYALISEIHNNGNVNYSKTQLDDHFWVEKISLIEVAEKGRERIAKIQNHSEEPTPAKIVRCLIDENRSMETEIDTFLMEPNENKTISVSKGTVFLLYNEERELIPLTERGPIYLIRNQEILSLSKENGLDYLIQKDSDEAFLLPPESKKLWDKSDGLLNKDSLSVKEKDILLEMESQGLIRQIKL